MTQPGREGERSVASVVLAGAILAGLLGGAALVAAGLWARPAGAAAAGLAPSLAFHGGLVLLAATLLTWIGRALHLMGAAGRPAASPTRGAVMVEFAMALLIAVPMAMILAQSTLLMVGNLAVQYSAFCAARTAAVQIGRDYGGDEQINAISFAEEFGKWRAIRRSAVYAVLPVSSSHTAGPASDAGLLADAVEGVYDAYGEAIPPILLNRLDHRLGYAEAYTEVRLTPPADGGLLYDPHEDLVVDVEHVFCMTVPYANRIYALLDDDGVDLDIAGYYGMVIRSRSVLPNTGSRDYIVVEEFPR